MFLRKCKYVTYYASISGSFLKFNVKNNNSQTVEVFYEIFFISQQSGRTLNVIFLILFVS